MSMVIDQSDVLIIVPAFNEAASIGDVISELKLQSYDILVVSDGSTDATARIARENGARVLDLPINLGVGGALQTGFKYAVDNGYLAVVQVDADGQHLPEELEKLIQHANNSSSHLVIGSRFRGPINGYRVTKIRRFGMILLSMSATRAAQTSITDATSGFRLIREPLLSEFSRHFATNYLGDTYESIVSAGKARYRVSEIEVKMSLRTNGVSSAGFFSALGFAVKGLFVAALGLHRRLKSLVDIN
jgi:glycosyltransferase involved in cell wall biosynthesis